MRRLFLFIFILGCCALLNAQVVFTENFNYTVGSTLVANGYTAHSGTGTNALTVTASSLAYPGYAASGIGGAVKMVNSGEDVNKKFITNDSIFSGSVYLSLLVKVDSAKTGDYFVHLASPAMLTSSYALRVHVKTALNGKLAFGISRLTTTAGYTPKYTDSVYNVGTTYLLVAKYQFVTGADNNDIVSLWVNPALQPTEPTPSVTYQDTSTVYKDVSSLGSICIRQGTSSTAPYVTIDGLIISKSWLGDLGNFNAVTFKANMKAQILKGNFNKAQDSLCVRGNFQYNAGDPNGDWQGYRYKMTDADNDSIYTVTVNLPQTYAGTNYEFKFVKNDNGWEMDPNRVFTLQAAASQQLPVLWFNNDSNFTQNVTVSFRVNMKNQIKKGLFSKTADSLCVRGSFQQDAGDLGGNWQGYKFKMTDPDNDSVYAVNAVLPSNLAGTNYEFKFVKNDNGWEPDPNRSFVLQSAASQLLPIYWFANDSVYRVLVTNTIVFTADMSDLYGTGQYRFDPATDSLLVMGLDWDGLGVVVSGVRKMTELVTPAKRFKTTLTVQGYLGDSTKWKFKAFPDAKFDNGGWELTADRWFTYTTNGSTTTLPEIKPNITMPVGVLTDPVSVTFSILLDSAKNKYNGQLIPLNSVDFIGIKGSATQLGNWGGTWTVSDTANGTMLKLNDLGQNGDLVAGDHIFSRTVTFAAGTPITEILYKYAAHYPGADTVNGGSYPLDNETGYGTNHKFTPANGRNERLLEIFGKTDRILKVVAPNGGEVFTTGASAKVLWTSSVYENVKIEYSTDNGTTWSAVSTVPAYQTNYIWTVPNVNSTQCKIKISNAANTADFDISDHSFTIQNSTPQITWQNIVTVKDNGNVQAQLTFGMAPSATNGIDLSLGESSLPPLPPAGNFDSRFELPVTPVDFSLKDFRADAQGAVWNIKFQPGPGGYPFTLSWSPATLPAGSFILKDIVSGTLVNVDMKTTGSVVVSNTGIGALAIVYTKNLCRTIGLKAGWNMVSVPLTAADLTVATIFPAATSQAYLFNNGYQTATTLTPGKGYWIRYANADSVSVCGTVPGLTLPLAAGWNLIGIYHNDLQVSSITTTPANIINSQFYEYNNGYVVPTILKSGKGYWVRTSQAGTMDVPVPVSLAKNDVITPSLIQKDFGRLVVCDAASQSATLYFTRNSNAAGSSAFDLPPVPPAGIFDVRFAGNRQITSGDEGQDVVISGALYPVTLSVTNTDLKVTDKATSGKLVNRTLKAGESLTLSDEAVTTLHVESAVLPSAFELMQNYPNPFNPTTTIKFAVPEKSRVTLKVYNQLGELVSVLADEVLEAGYHMKEWNAAGKSSGIYFYELRTEKFQSIKKLILLK